MRPSALTVKCRQGVSIARRRDHADEATGAVLIGNVVQLAQQASVIGLVAGIGRQLISRFSGSQLLVLCVARRAHAGRTTKRIHFES